MERIEHSIHPSRQIVVNMYVIDNVGGMGYSRQCGTGLSPLEFTCDPSLMGGNFANTTAWNSVRLTWDLPEILVGLRRETTN